MYLMIDNYDSFVHNLASYFEELGEEMTLVRNDKLSMKEIQTWIDEGKLDGLLISPGPKSPQDCGMSLEALRRFAGQIPILGICLGHQIIGYAWGARIKKGAKPMHGKITAITNTQRHMFANLPSRFQVTRYHSLVVDAEKLPSCLDIDALSEDGAIMAIRHKTLPVYGIQFHPEAVLTEYGHELLQNFIDLCKEWKNSYENNCAEAVSL
ncbi:MAG: aminodeoxychorismate/anthranilate synthase component II [Eubacteriales bacterium]|nr:aminodeoxychorismate/anthranilate synthase component II [Eubacteriales bacterium]